MVTGSAWSNSCDQHNNTVDFCFIHSDRLCTILIDFQAATVNICIRLLIGNLYNIMGKNKTMITLVSHEHYRGVRINHHGEIFCLKSFYLKDERNVKNIIFLIS